MAKTTQAEKMALSVHRRLTSIAVEGVKTAHGLSVALTGNTFSMKGTGKKVAVCQVGVSKASGKAVIAVDGKQYPIQDLGAGKKANYMKSVRIALVQAGITGLTGTTKAGGIVSLD